MLALFFAADLTAPKQGAPFGRLLDADRHGCKVPGALQRSNEGSVFGRAEASKVCKFAALRQCSWLMVDAARTPPGAAMDLSTPISALRPSPFSGCLMFVCLSLPWLAW